MTNSLLNHCIPPAKKLKEGWVKFVDKVKYKRQKKKATKKMKKIEQELIFRAMTNQGTPTLEGNGCSRVASLRSRQDSDPVRSLHTINTVTTNVLMERYGDRNPDRFCWLCFTRCGAILSTTWLASKRTWWNSSCRTRCGALAIGLWASPMWVVNLFGVVHNDPTAGLLLVAAL